MSITYHSRSPPSSRSPVTGKCVFINTLYFCTLYLWCFFLSVCLSVSSLHMSLCQLCVCANIFYSLILSVCRPHSHNQAHGHHYTDCFHSSHAPSDYCSTYSTCVTYTSHHLLHWNHAHCDSTYNHSSGYRVFAEHLFAGDIYPQYSTSCYYCTTIR